MKPIIPQHSIVTALLFPLSLALWFASVATIELNLGDLGLIHSLPLTFFAGVTLLNISLLLNLLSANSNRTLAAVHVFTLAVYLYLTPYVVELSPRFLPAYDTFVHVERALSLSYYHVFPYVMNPALIHLATILILVTGMNPILLLSIFTFLSAILYTFPIYVLVKIFVKDEKNIWIAISLFYLMAWVSFQNFTTQNLGFIMYLFALATFLNHIVYPVNRRKWSSKILVILFILSLGLSHFFSLVIFFANLLTIVLLGLVPLSIPIRKVLSKLKNVICTIIFVELIALIMGLLQYLQQSSIVPLMDIQDICIYIIDCLHSLFSFSTFTANVHSIIYALIWLYLSPSASAPRTMVNTIRFLHLALLAVLVVVGIVQLHKSRKIEGRLLTPIMVSTFASSPFIPFIYAEALLRASMHALPILAVLAASAPRRKYMSAYFLVFFLISPTLHYIAGYGSERVDYLPPSEFKASDFSIYNGIKGFIGWYGGVLSRKIAFFSLDALFRDDVAVCSQYFLLSKKDVMVIDHMHRGEIMEGIMHNIQKITLKVGTLLIYNNGANKAYVITQVR